MLRIQRKPEANPSRDNTLVWGTAPTSLPGRSRFLEVRPSPIQGMECGPYHFPYMRAGGFLLPNIASDCMQFFARYLPFMVDHSCIYCSSTPEPMLYWPDHLFMFRNYVFDSRFPCIGARSTLNSGEMEFGSYSALGSEPSAQSLCDDPSFFSRIYKSPSANPLSLARCNVRTNSDERSSPPTNRYAGTLKETYKTEDRLRGAVGMDIYFCFGVNADARQAQRDSELTEVNGKRKTKSAIHYAIHDAAKGMLKVGVTDLVTPPQLRS